jgi:RHS repeat-associated protein
VVTTSYYLGGQLVAQRVGSDSTWVTTYIHQDSLGSTSVMSKADGTLDSSMTFYPFGATRTGSVNTTKEFTGQRLDSTGLYYYNARYYDPAIGRFISADALSQRAPVGAYIQLSLSVSYSETSVLIQFNQAQREHKYHKDGLYNPQLLNRYSYAVNNPMKYTDPTGHDLIVNTWDTNDKGETRYTICDGEGILIDIATGIEELAWMMKKYGKEYEDVKIPLGQGALDFFRTTHTGPKPSDSDAYSDYNFSIGEGIVWTTGIIIDKYGKFHWYVGAGVGWGTPVTVSQTFSENAVKRGLSEAFTASACIFFQWGNSLDDFAPFGERGWGFGAGVSYGYIWIF